MNICIDGLGVARLFGTGLYSYTYELIDNLLDIYPQPHYDIIWDSLLSPNLWNKFRNLSFSNPHLNRKQNDYSLLEEHIKKNKIDIFHSPSNGFSIPSVKAAKYVMTVHDLMPVSHREHVDLKYFNRFHQVFPEVLKRCDRIIAVSGFLKDQIINYYPVSEEKIDVVYPGCPPQFAPIRDDDCRAIIKDKFGMEGDFILYSGSIHARKNLHVLIKVFSKILKHSDNIKLVIAGCTDGKRQEYFFKLKSLVEQLNLGKSVVFMGAVGYDDMPYLYNSAKCTVNLSLYEGFPLSTIEAMACGTPTLCLNTSSFKETAGDSTTYGKLNDEDGLKDLIMKAIYDRDYRSIIRDKGLNQSKKYSWEKSTKRLVNIYESIA